MAYIPSFTLLALGVVVLASTPAPDTSLGLWDRPQPLHLPWAWNQTFPVPHTSLASSATHTEGTNSTFMVTVGGEGELVFSPPSLNASVGSVIAFNFLALNHTLTQSNLTDPCLFNGGFDSGFAQFNPLNISGKNIVEFTVQTDNPQWFFCAQRMKVSHCHSGMVFSLNPGGNHSNFVQNARSSSIVDAQPTLACSHSVTHTPANGATPTLTGTLSATVGPNSTAISPLIANIGSTNPAIGLSLVASFYALIL